MSIEVAFGMLTEASKQLVLPGRLRHALALFEEALEIHPHLQATAWERGFALYWAGRCQEAAEQFATSMSLDVNDVELFIWQAMCEARFRGFASAQRAALNYQGYDRRPHMMKVLSLFRGEDITPEEILAGASADSHSLARVSFLISLYYEARGQLEKAVMHLNTVVEDAGQARDNAGDTYMREIARCHLRILKRRLVVQSLATANNEQLCMNMGNSNNKSSALFAWGKGCAAAAHSLEVMVGQLIKGSPTTAATTGGGVGGRKEE